nr:uncharacterized protein LOC129278747 [Lytechinus pictus]
MARINIVLVVALTCISEVCFANNNDTTTTTTGATTTGRKHTTTWPVTTTAHTTTGATTRTGLTTGTAGNISSTTPSVTSGGTTSAPGPRYRVKDKDGKLCMLIDFGGTITDVIHGKTLEIPTNANTSRSNCSSSSYAAFDLRFSEDIFTEWHINLNFTTRGRSFKLREVSASMFSLGSSLSSSLDIDFFRVPVGSYYNCTNLNLTLSYFQLNLTQPLFQPFVQKTKGGDNWGQGKLTIDDINLQGPGKRGTYRELYMQTQT